MPSSAGKKKKRNHPGTLHPSASLPAPTAVPASPGPPPCLPSLPPRRSSDLPVAAADDIARARAGDAHRMRLEKRALIRRDDDFGRGLARAVRIVSAERIRSEEHTSELQSPM